VPDPHCDGRGQRRIRRQVADPRARGGMVRDPHVLIAGHRWLVAHADGPPPLAHGVCWRSGVRTSSACSRRNDGVRRTVRHRFLETCLEPYDAHRGGGSSRAPTVLTEFNPSRESTGQPSRSARPPRRRDPCGRDGANMGRRVPPLPRATAVESCTGLSSITNDSAAVVPEGNRARLPTSPAMPRLRRHLAL